MTTLMNERVAIGANVQPRGAGAIARAVDIQNALRITIGDYVLAFYSAPNGVAHPDLSGPSKAKRNIVDEMQLQMDDTEGGVGPTRFALFYEADELGLKHTAVGVLSSAHEWYWRVTAFQRDERGDAIADGPKATPPSHPSYDQQPVSDLPPLPPKKKPGEGQRGQGLPSDHS
jgi:hypothetical protein